MILVPLLKFEVGFGTNRAAHVFQEAEGRREIPDHFRGKCERDEFSYGSYQ